MERTRSTVEELAFKTAELDEALRKAGFDLALADPSASRDFSYRARYLRGKSTFFPRLQANLEYYLATRSFSLKISADSPSAGVEDMSAYSCLVKNYRGSLQELLERYFDSIRRGVPFMLGESRK
jgi:hypothetical protein